MAPKPVPGAVRSICSAVPWRAFGGCVLSVGGGHISAGFNMRPAHPLPTLPSPLPGQVFVMGVFFQTETNSPGLVTAGLISAIIGAWFLRW